MFGAQAHSHTMCLGICPGFWPMIIMCVCVRISFGDCLKLLVTAIIHPCAMHASLDSIIFRPNFEFTILYIYIIIQGRHECVDVIYSRRKTSLV